MGLTQWDKFPVDKIAIPIVTISEQRPFVHLVESILSAKADNPSADTRSVEAEIDRLVYDLYELTSQEITLLKTMEKNVSLNR